MSITGIFEDVRKIQWNNSTLTIEREREREKTLKELSSQKESQGGGDSPCASRGRNSHRPGEPCRAKETDSEDITIVTYYK